MRLYGGACDDGASRQSRQLVKRTAEGRQTPDHKKHHILHLLQIHQDLSIHIYVFFSALVLCTVFAFVFVFLHLCVCPSVPYLYFCECFLLLLYLFVFVFLHLCVFSLLLYCIGCFSDNLTPLLCGRQLTVEPEYKY